MLFSKVCVCVLNFLKIEAKTVIYELISFSYPY